MKKPESWGGVIGGVYHANKIEENRKPKDQIFRVSLTFPPIGTSSNWHFPKLAIPPTGTSSNWHDYFVQNNQK